MTNVVSNTIANFAINNTTPFFLTTTGVINSNATALSFVGGSTPGSATIAGNISGHVGIQTNGNDHIDVTQTGVVLATDSNDSIGVFLSGTGNSLRVAGNVTSDGIGIYVSSPDNEIVITETGVVHGGASKHDPAVGNSYSGAIMVFSSGEHTIVNNGDIIAEVNEKTGFRIAVADSGAGGAPNGLDPTFQSDLSLYNTGFIFGDLFFAAGEDLYDARGGGIVNGAIDMGAEADIFRGGDHDEEAVGGLGNDLMRGGGGDDSLNGQAGADTVNGNSGDDDLSGSFGLDSINGGSGDDLLNGGGNADTVVGASGNDEINGGDGSDFLVGGDGQDDMIGGRGGDEMRGASGDDQLAGGQGNDTLTGGTGNDTLRGNDNFDTFFFARGFGSDVIVDFSGNNAEKIDLSRVGSIVNFNDLSNNHLSQSGDDAIIDAGNGNVITLADFQANALDAGDFIF